MANFPCPNPVACPGTENPLANLSAERVDRRKFYGYRFFADVPTVCITDTEEEADRCFPPHPTNPALPTVYFSNEQQCTLPCPTGGTETGTAEAGSFAALTQAQADASAYEFACLIASILCAGGTVTIFHSTAQSCTVNCPNGTQFTYTIPANSAVGLTQSAADASAYLLACAIAAELCSGLPPDSTGALPFGGAGSPPPFPSGPNFANSPVTGSSTCVNGSIFYFTVRAGEFISGSRDAANSMAQSYANRKALENQVCMGDLAVNLCENTFYTSAASVSFAGPVLWTLASGDLPTGVFMSNGVLAGTPLISGTYTFTLRAAASDGSYVERTYTLTVRGILTSSLPDGTTGTPYSQTLQASEFTAPVWTISAGSLPDGLSLNSGTGEISGTPTSNNTFNFTVQASQDDYSCTRELSIVVASSLAPAEWWTMEVSDPMIGVVNGVNMPLTLGGLPMIAAAGKVNLAESQNSDASTADFARFLSAHSAAIRPLGNPITIFGWVNITKSGVNNGAVLYIDYVGDAWPDSVQMQISDNGANGTYRIFYGINQVLTGNLPAFSTWFFFQLTLNTNGTISIRFNNGSTSTSAVTALSLVPVATGHMMVQFSMGEDPPLGLLLDELCLFNTVLSQSDIDGIYNGGAGRTWP